MQNRTQLLAVVKDHFSSNKTSRTLPVVIRDSVAEFMLSEQYSLRKGADLLEIHKNTLKRWIDDYKARLNNPLIYANFDLLTAKDISNAVKELNKSLLNVTQNIAEAKIKHQQELTDLENMANNIHRTLLDALEHFESHNNDL